VGDGNAFTTSLPCPPSLLADCIYNVTVTATSSYWFESSPDGIFIVFGDSQDYTNWNNGNAYNAVAGPAVDTDSFSSGLFYVPSGSTFIFVAYNDNAIEDMNVDVSIEYYPNTAAGSATSSGTQGANENAKSVMTSAELFAFGFVVGINDEEPYTPPPATCLQSMTAGFNDVNAIISTVSQNSFTASSILTQVQQMFSDFSTALKACNPNSCPGFTQSIFSDALDDLLQVIPVVDAVDDAVKGAELLYHGYNIMTDIYNIVEASGTDMWYQRGYDTANIIRQIQAVKSDLSGRRSVRNTTRHTLRHHDGVVRSLQQWRVMYNRTAFNAAAVTTPSSSSSSSSLTTGAIAGIAVAVVCVSLLAAIAAIVVIRRRSASMENNNTNIASAQPNEELNTNLLSNASVPYEAFHDRDTVA